MKPYIFLSSAVEINISAPLSAVNPIACFVSNNAETIPLTGETALPTVGIIATPFPIISSEKVISLTCFKETALPSIGDNTTELDVTSSFSTATSSVVSSSSSLLVGSSNPNIHVNIN